MNDKTEPTTGEVLPPSTVVATALANFEPFDAQLEEFRAQYADVVYDMDDPEQNARARSDRASVGKVIASLDRTHAEVKGPLLDATRQLDGRRKDLKDQFIAIQGNSKGQIAEHEAREERRVEALDARVQEIREMALPEMGVDMTVGKWAARLVTVESIEIDDSFAERKPDAALAKMETIASIKANIKYAEEQAELLRLRKETEARERADREEQIRVEAEAKAKAEAEEAAKAEAERVEREKVEAQAAHDAQLKAEQEAREQAERDKVAAEERAVREQQEAADKAAAEERKRIEDEHAERERKEAGEREKEVKRKARQAHRQKIHAEAKASLIAAMQIDENTATSVIESIRDHEIAHVSIDY